jgi:hypothetical protein
VYRENDNIDWDTINAYAALPAEELDRLIAENEEMIKKEINK